MRNFSELRQGEVRKGRVAAVQKGPDRRRGDAHIVGYYALGRGAEIGVSRALGPRLSLLSGNNPMNDWQ